MKEAPSKKALKFWTKLGFISFGGPAGQIAIMHQEVVERQNWIGENQFLGALNFCMLLPGPEAQQLATYIGWRRHGTLGGIFARCLFVSLFHRSLLCCCSATWPWLTSIFRQRRLPFTASSRWWWP
jgi:chromate transporter